MGREKDFMTRKVLLGLLFFGSICVIGCGGGGSSSPAPKPPTANAGGPYTGTLGTAISFSGSGSSDPQGQTLTYAWNFGDSATGTGVSPTHAYSSAGVYTVSLTVTDTSNLSSTATTTATVPNGSVKAGQAPVSGAHVYLFSANTTGYGQPSVSLLNAASTGESDSVGAYVSTGSDGSFVFAGDYTCTPGTQVYVYALGGNPGAGTNPASGLLAALGNCPTGGSFEAIPYIQVNEVSTVAAAYAFAGFATDATHVSSSGTALAQTGIKNAFANAANLASLSTGVALAVTPNANGQVPQAEINTLANILAACVNSNGALTGPTDPSPCFTLFSNATVNGTASGAQPTETASAAINIAHYPGANVAALYALSASDAAFAPALTTEPNNFALALQFGTANTNSIGNLAIDASGDVWISSFTGSSIAVELSPAGGVLSGADGFGSDSSRAQFGSIALDPAGNAWVAPGPGEFIAELSSSGVVLSGTNGYTGGGMSDTQGIAVDGSGNAWVADGNAYNVIKLSPAGTPLSGANGYTGGGLSYPCAIAPDGLGNIWVINYLGNSVTELTSAGTPLSGANGYTGGGMSGTTNIAIDGTNSAWIVGETNTVKISRAGAFLSGTSGFTTAANGAIAIDGAGNAFISNHQKNTLTELTNSGDVVEGAAAYTGPGIGAIYSLAVDGSGNLWTTAGTGAGGPILELIGIATPVVTPLSVGSENNTLGTRP